MIALSGDAVAIAPRLLGARLISSVGGLLTAVEITEVEAYRDDDQASHSHRGPTPANRAMFGPPGRLHVYRSYGIHWCANVVTGPEGSGAAILFRAGRPLDGIDTMRMRRGRGEHLADGPGKLCQALGITGIEDGVDLLAVGSPVRLQLGEVERDYVATPRIGISKAVDLPWRFVAE